MISKRKNIMASHTEHELQKAFAVLIKNTRTTRRHLSLIEIAGWLKTAVKILGSINDVADRIGLSPKMLRQFEYVNILSQEVQDLFAERKIDSVDIAAHLKMLEEKDQIQVAKEAAKGQLNSADVRAVRELRKESPNLPINEVIERIKTTRNIKQYIVEFVVRSKKTDKKLTEQRFAKALGRSNIINITLNGSIGRLVMNTQGKNRLQQLARERMKTKAVIVSSIVQGEIE